LVTLISENSGDSTIDLLADEVGEQYGTAAALYCQSQAALSNPKSRSELKLLKEKQRHSQYCIELSELSDSEIEQYLTLSSDNPNAKDWNAWVKQYGHLSPSKLKFNASALKSLLGICKGANTKSKSGWFDLLKHKLNHATAEQLTGWQSETEGMINMAASLVGAISNKPGLADAIKTIGTASSKSVFACLAWSAGFMSTPLMFTTVLDTMMSLAVFLANGKAPKTQDVVQTQLAEIQEALTDISEQMKLLNQTQQKILSELVSVSQQLKNFSRSCMSQLQTIEESINLLYDHSLQLSRDKANTKLESGYKKFESKLASADILKHGDFYDGLVDLYTFAHSTAANTAFSGATMSISKSLTTLATVMKKRQHVELNFGLLRKFAQALAPSFEDSLLNTSISIPNPLAWSKGVSLFASAWLSNLNDKHTKNNALLNELIDQGDYVLKLLKALRSESVINQGIEKYSASVKALVEPLANYFVTSKLSQQYGKLLFHGYSLPKMFYLGRSVNQDIAPFCYKIGSILPKEYYYFIEAHNKTLFTLEANSFNPLDGKPLKIPPTNPRN
jgi:hypothetical protein